MPYGHLLQTPRLSLRHYQPAHKSGFVALNTCAINREHMNGPHTPERAATLFETFLSPDSNSLQLAVCLNKSEEYIGHLFATPEDSGYEIGFIFDKAYWGQGLGTEAVQSFLPIVSQTLNTCDIFATVDVDHPASIALLERAGFRQTRQEEDEFGPYWVYCWLPD